jgi:hypothetical protein
MEREDAGPGPEEAMSAAGKPGEIEFLRLDEDGKHARKVPIRVVSQPAEPGTPNPVRIRVRYAPDTCPELGGCAAVKHLVTGAGPPLTARPADREEVTS